MSSSTIGHCRRSTGNAGASPRRRGMVGRGCAGLPAAVVMFRLFLPPAGARQGHYRTASGGGLKPAATTRRARDQASR